MVAELPVSLSSLRASSNVARYATFWTVCDIGFGIALVWKGAGITPLLIPAAGAVPANAAASNVKIIYFEYACP